MKLRTDNIIDIMFVGQGAGAEEDQKGRPFQGPAGKLLRTKVKPVLEANQLNIILDNTIRARPLDEKGKNRAPTNKELEFCKEILWERIEEFKPNVIIPLGASATGTLIPRLEKVAISRVRGVSVQLNGHTFLPTFHPAAILHAQETETKLMLEKHMVEDITQAVKLANQTRNLI